MSKCLVTGGAGLIGSHIVDLLVEKGHEVTVIDNLEPITHPNGRPNWINKTLKCFLDRDVSDCDAIQHTIRDGIDYIFHQAAIGGVTSEWSKMVYSNVAGTANIFQALKNLDIKPKKIILASSQAVYQNSLYSETKKAQEGICFTLGKEMDIPIVALRYGLTYGPRQSLSNPYTGICSIFANKIHKGESPIIYEDGKQLRDFTFVKDVARVNVMAMENDEMVGVFDVGTGFGHTVKLFCEALIDLMGSSVKPNITGEKRMYDRRNVVVDSQKLRALGFEFDYSPEAGLTEYVKWFKETVK